VLGVAEAEEKADRHGFRVPEIRQRAEVERLENAVGPAALAHTVVALERHERRRVFGARPVEVSAILAPEVEQVLEARGGDERGARAAALEDRIRRDRRPVREALDLGEVERLDGREHGLLLPCGRRHLDRPNAALVHDHGVCERPAHADAEKRHPATVRPLVSGRVPSRDAVSAGASRLPASPLGFAREWPSS
jgi:hypothetical protein